MDSSNLSNVDSLRQDILPISLTRIPSKLNPKQLLAIYTWITASNCTYSTIFTVMGEKRSHILTNKISPPMGFETTPHSIRSMHHALDRGNVGHYSLYCIIFYYQKSNRIQILYLNGEEYSGKILDTFKTCCT